MINATPLFRPYAKHRLRQLDAMNPPRAQEHQLRKLVRTAANTRFGRDHRFAEIQSVADFQARVPIRAYEDFWSDYWKADFPNFRNVSWPGAFPYWASTSGTTTGIAKYIPCPASMVRSNQRAAFDVLSFHYRDHPDFAPMDGKSFMLGGSTELLEEGPGRFSGDLSGIAAKTMPIWAKPYRFPATDLSLLKDWDEKLDVLAQRSRSEKIRVLTGTPIWLLLLFQRIEALGANAGRNSVNPFPDLQLLIHGGISYEPYKSRIDPILERVGAARREVYPASEGFIAVADKNPGEGLRLILDNGLFFEFIPLSELGADNPTRHWVGNIETDLDYAIIISSCAGVFAYLIGDTVRFVDRDPPRLIITGRTSYMISAFGEHLIGEEVEAAVLAAATTANVEVLEFSMGPIFSHIDGAAGRHLYVIELDQSALSGQARDDLIERISNAIDEDLKIRNDDYIVHRGDGVAMGHPEVALVPPGSFADWMRKRGKLGGQHKVPRVITHPELFDNLLTHMKTPLTNAGPFPQ
jgi:hypothetical protein